MEEQTGSLPRINALPVLRNCTLSAVLSKEGGKATTELFLAQYPWKRLLNTPGKGCYTIEPLIKGPKARLVFLGLQ